MAYLPNALRQSRLRTLLVPSIGTLTLLSPAALSRYHPAIVCDANAVRRFTHTDQPALLDRIDTIAASAVSRSNATDLAINLAFHHCIPGLSCSRKASATRSGSLFDKEVCFVRVVLAIFDEDPELERFGQPFDLHERCVSQ
jgi:hypothetical protein